MTSERGNCVREDREERNAFLTRGLQGQNRKITLCHKMTMFPFLYFIIEFKKIRLLNISFKKNIIFHSPENIDYFNYNKKLYPNVHFCNNILKKIRSNMLS